MTAAHPQTCTHAQVSPWVLWWGLDWFVRSVRAFLRAFGGLESMLVSVRSFCCGCRSAGLGLGPFWRAVGVGGGCGGGGSEGWPLRARGSGGAAAGRAASRYAVPGGERGCSDGERDP